MLVTSWKDKFCSVFYGRSISMVDIYELQKCLINLQLLVSHSMTKNSETLRNHRLFAELFKACGVK